MKLVASLGLMAASVYAADWQRFQTLWSDVSSAENLNEDDRKIMELFTISSIANYGCWCRFNKYHPYRGTPQDTIDEACKVWYQNYDCLAFDYNTDEPLFRCNIDTEYNDTLTQVQEPFEESTDFMAECATRNPNSDCAAIACAVDAEFIRSVFNYLADNTLNMTLSGWYGFDGNVCSGHVPKVGADGTTTVPPIFTTEAPAPGGTTVAPGTTQEPPQTMDCCGSYPMRYPFKLLEGSRSCCGSNTYNTNLLTCCPGNTIQLIGSC